MSLSRELYTTLEAIVGAKNISDKEYILAGNRNRTPEYPFDYHSADAIIMPGSTEEVRDIIRICNQNDICFVTEVSGVSADAFPNRAGTLLIDLKRRASRTVWSQSCRRARSRHEWAAMNLKRY